MSAQFYDYHATWSTEALRRRAVRARKAWSAQRSYVLREIADANGFRSTTTSYVLEKALRCLNATHHAYRDARIEYHWRLKGSPWMDRDAARQEWGLVPRLHCAATCTERTRAEAAS